MKYNILFLTSTFSNRDMSQLSLVLITLLILSENELKTTNDIHINQLMTNY